MPSSGLVLLITSGPGIVEFRGRPRRCAKSRAISTLCLFDRTADPVWLSALHEGSRQVQALAPQHVEYPHDINWMGRTRGGGQCSARICSSSNFLCVSLWRRPPTGHATLCNVERWCFKEGAVSESDDLQKHALECMRLAADCMQLVGDVHSPTLQRHFLRMARVWTTRAERGPGRGYPDQEFN
jgi:hypothetical protein